MRRTWRRACACWRRWRPTAARWRRSTSRRRARRSGWRGPGRGPGRGRANGSGKASPPRTLPVGAAARYAAEPDFAASRGRLSLHALDLRQLAAVEAFARALAATLPRLDVLVNNAAQTVRRPPAYYAALAAGEERVAPALLPL